jgi:predicted lipoprotein with Yx(FWY)xxD motif
LNHRLLLPVLVVINDLQEEHMLNQRIAIAAVGVAAAAAVGVALVGTNGYGTASKPPTVTATVHTVTATVGNTQETVLVDAAGLPLYYYRPDPATKSLVTGGLAGAWPPVVAAGSTAPATSGLKGSVTVVHDAHGNQVAYNGHLLYTFVSDHSGAVTGQGVQNFFVATPELASLTGQVQPAKTTNPAPGGYGY